MMLARQAGLRTPGSRWAASSSARMFVAAPARLSIPAQRHMRYAANSVRCFTQRRLFATPPPQVVHSDLPIEAYHTYADVTMDQLLESLENILDDIGDPVYEVEYSSGVLTLKLGMNGTYVINKQPPNKQIWLSSPVSGPKRFDYSTTSDRWVCSRDGRPLGELLDHELTDAFERPVNLGVGKVTELLA